MWRFCYLASDFHRGSGIGQALHSSHMPQPGLLTISLYAFPKAQRLHFQGKTGSFAQGYLYQKVFLLQAFEQGDASTGSDILFVDLFS